MATCTSDSEEEIVDNSPNSDNIIRYNFESVVTDDDDDDESI